MKRIFLIAVFSFFAVGSFAQGMFGAQAGLGYGTAYKSKITPAVEGYYLQQIFPRIYIGGSLFFSALFF